MEIKGTIPVRWAAQNGKDGNSSKIIYTESFTQPETPSGSSPSGWSEQSPIQPNVDVSFVGDWSLTEDNCILAPQVQADGISVCYIRITTYTDNQKVPLSVWSNTNGYLYIGKIDTAFSTENPWDVIYPSGSTEEIYENIITISTAGVHTLCIGLVESTSPLSTRYAKVKIGNKPIWLSSSLTYDENGNILTWANPVIVSRGTIISFATENHANLLYQTAFVPTQMGKWDIANGVTAEGMNGVNSYKCVADVASSSYKDILRQKVYDVSGEKQLLPNKWYTLSFYAKSSPYITLQDTDLVTTAQEYSVYFLSGNATFSMEMYVSASMTIYVEIVSSSFSTSFSASLSAGINTLERVVNITTAGKYQIQISSSTGSAFTIKKFTIDRGNMKMWSYVYPSCVDNTAGMVVDNVQKGSTPSDAYVLWSLTDSFVKHTITFKTKSVISENQYVLFRIPTAGHDAFVCMPKLEEGTYASDYVTNDADVADIASNKTGFPYDNGIFNESQVYVWNEQRRDFINYEFDGTFYKFGVRTKGMSVPVNTPPTSASGDEYWEVSHKIQTLVTDTVFGTNANIGGFMATNSQMKSINGSLKLDGLKGIIELLHDDYTWRVNDDGIQVMGVDGGRRIEFDPSQKDVRIYDDDGSEVANLSGNTFSDISKIFGSSVGDFDLTAFSSGGDEIRPINQLLQESQTVQIATATTSTATRLSFDGTLLADANKVRTEDTGLMDDQGRYYYPNLAIIELYVISYSTSSMTTIVQPRKKIYTLASRGDNGGSASLTNIFVDVPAGYHVVYIDYYLEAIYSNYSPNSHAKVEWNINSISYVSDFYVSRLFGNGFAYGSSADNYIAAINEGGKMRHKMVTGNCGYDIYDGTIKIMLNNVWYTLSRKTDGSVVLT